MTWSKTMRTSQSLLSVFSREATSSSPTSSTKWLNSIQSVTKVFKYQQSLFVSRAMLMKGMKIFLEHHASAILVYLFFSSALLFPYTSIQMLTSFKSCRKWNCCNPLNGSKYLDKPSKYQVFLSIWNPIFWYILMAGTCELMVFK